MRDILDRLDKIQPQELDEAPDDVRQAIQQRVEKIPDETDLLDVLKYTRKYSLKKDVEKFTTLRDYKDTVSSVFLKALADAELPDTQIKKFLKKLAADGILDEKRLMTPRQVHTTKDIIDDAYENVFDAIKTPVFRDISGKIGEMGDVGKGEYLLDILSPSVNRRGAPGDLDVNGVKVELKAGENGRIGPAGSQSLAGRFQREFVPVLNKLMPRKKIPDPTAFNPKLNMSDFTDFFEGDAKKVKTALAYMLEMHYPEGVDVKKIANTVVDSGGNINGQQLKREMLAASYQVYRDAKEFDGIIVMDKDITKFLYIGSADDARAVADSLVVSFPSWTDTQGNAMKITLAKGTRQAGGAVAGGTGGGRGRASTQDLDQVVGARRLTGPGAKAARTQAAAKTDAGTLGRERRR
jgi:hypothetical protein